MRHSADATFGLGPDKAGGQIVTIISDAKPTEPVQIGKARVEDQPPRFSEPAGLSVAGGKLYVADTNNHRIRTVDVKTGAVSTMEIAAAIFGPAL